MQMLDLFILQNRFPGELRQFLAVEENKKESAHLFRNNPLCCGDINFAALKNALK